MPRSDMISIDFSRELDFRFQEFLPKYLCGRRRTRQRVEYVIEAFIEMKKRKAESVDPGFLVQL